MERLAELAEYDRAISGLMDEDFLAAGFTPDEIASYRLQTTPQLTPFVSRPEDTLTQGPTSYRTTSPQGGYADIYGSSFLARQKEEPASVGFARDYMDFFPVIGDVLGAGEVVQELTSEDPNYPLAAALGAATVVGAVPVIGDPVARAVANTAQKVFDSPFMADVIGNTRALGGLDFDFLRGRGDPAMAQGVGADVPGRAPVTFDDVERAMAEAPELPAPTGFDVWHGTPVMQGRSKKGLEDFFNPDGLSWGTTNRETAEQFAGRNEVYWPYRDPPESTVEFSGEVYDLNFDLRNPMDVDISQTMWDRNKELALVAEAKAAGHDGLRISHPGGKIDYVAFDPSQVSRSTPSSPAQEAPTEIDVWHGTPHEFPPAIRVLDKETGKTYVQAADDPIATGMIAQQPNRYEIVQENPLGMFDFSKMGTGEGAQAYGWGGYQAQRRGIGQSYRDQLTDNAYGDRRIYSLDGQDLPEPTFIQKQVAGGLPPEDIVANRKKRIGLLEARIKDAPALSKGDDLTPSDFSRMSDEIDLKKMREEMAEAQSLVGKRIESRDPGALYQSKIMANPDEFMSWERPISEQAPNVREAFGLEGKVRDLIDRRKGLLDAYTSAADPASGDGIDAFFRENPAQKKIISDLEQIESEIKSTPFGLLARDFSTSEIDRIGSLTGQEAYEALTDAVGALDWPVGAAANQRRMFQSQGQKNASKMLNDLGVPGSTHIDAATRSQPYAVELAYKGKPFEEGYFEPQFAQSKEEAESIAREYQERGYDTTVRDVATRNYVVFDENLINIVKKYGIAGAAAFLGANTIDVEQALADNMTQADFEDLVAGPE